MIDAQGRKVTVAWAPHELLWLEIAIRDGASGIRQLSELTGRTESAIKDMAYKCGYSVKRRVPMVVAPTPRKILRRPIAPPTPATIRPLTARELMTGGARRRVTVEMVAL